MRNLHSQVARIPLIVLSMLFLLPGCVNLEPAPDDTVFHVLQSPTRAVKSSEGTRLSVRNVRLTDYLQNSKVVQRDPSNEIRHLSNHRWAGDLNEMIALAVAAELETANPSVFASVGEVPSPDVWIDLHILQFELVEDHGSVVTLEYRVTNAHSQELLNEGRLSKRSVQGAPGVTQAIDELKRLLGELASEIGTGI